MLIILLFLFAIGRQAQAQHYIITDTDLSRNALENALSGGIVVSNQDNLELRIGGQIQADFMYDFNEIKSDEFFKPSGIAVPTNNLGKTFFNVSDSRLRFNVSYDPGEQGWKTTGYFEMDFRNDNFAPRIRHAWIEVGNLGLGQTWTNFGDNEVFPDLVVNTGGPNALLLSRQIQLRYTFHLPASQLAIALEQHNSGIEFPEGWSDRQVYPNVTASYKVSWNRSHLRVGGVLNPINYTTAQAPDDLETELGYAASFSGNIGVGQNKNAVKFQASYGSGYANYVEDLSHQGLEGYVNNDGIDTYDVFSGWLFYDHFWNNRWGTTLGYGYNKVYLPDNAAATMLDHTHMAVANVHCKIRSNVKMALEGIWGQRVNHLSQGGAENTGDNYRIQYTTVILF